MSKTLSHALVHLFFILAGLGTLALMGQQCVQQMAHYASPPTAAPATKSSPTGPLASELANPSANQPSEQAASQPANQPSDQIASQLADQPRGQAAPRPLVFAKLSESALWSQPEGKKKLESLAPHIKGWHIQVRPYQSLFEALPTARSKAQDAALASTKTSVDAGKALPTANSNTQGKPWPPAKTLVGARKTSAGEGSSHPLQWQVCKSWQPQSLCWPLRSFLQQAQGSQLLVELKLRHAQGVESLADMFEAHTSNHTRGSLLPPLAATEASTDLPLATPRVKKGSELTPRHTRGSIQPPLAVVWQVSHQGVLKKLRRRQPLAWYGLKAADVVKLNFMADLGLEALVEARADFYLPNLELSPRAQQVLHHRGVLPVLLVQP